MKAAGLLVVRAALALVGAVALYVILYGLTGWLADTMGNDTVLGHVFAVVNGMLSPLAWAIVAVPLMALLIYWILARFAFKPRQS